jgi:hypothetical protein
MAKKFDTSWFNLKNYQGLKDLDLYGWYRQLAIRERIKSILLSDGDILKIEGKGLNNFEGIELLEALSERKLLAGIEWEARYAEPALRWVERIKSHPILDLNDLNEETSGLKYPFNTYSVTSIPAWDFYLIVNDGDLSKVWRTCDNLYNEGEVTEEQGKLIGAPYDLLAIEDGILGSNGLAHVTVDLTATDEQIKEDFCHWLTEYRKVINFGPKNKKQNKFFTREDLSHWEEERLLPYIDLWLITKVEGKRITYPDRAKLIFNDELKSVPNSDPILGVCRTFLL